MRFGFLICFAPVELEKGRASDFGHRENDKPISARILKVVMMSRHVLTALPVYNEESHIAAVLQEVYRYSDDVLVVDDGSSDNTPRLLATQTDSHVISHPANLGYGAALRTAFQHAILENYDILVTIDCDGQHEPRLIPALAAEIVNEHDGGADLVSGSRYLKIFPGDSIPPIDRRQINGEITRQLNARLGLELTDSFCGFKAYRVEALKQLQITELGYAMPLQVWVQAAALGWRIVEFPVPLVYLEEERSFGGSLDDSRRRMAYYQELLEREFAAAGFPCASGTDP